MSGSQRINLCSVYPERKANKKQPKTVYYQKLEEKLKNYFGYKVKIDSNKIIKDGIHVLKEDELNTETIKWINSNLYSSEMELEL